MSDYSTPESNLKFEIVYILASGQTEAKNMVVFKVKNSPPVRLTFYGCVCLLQGICVV
jgi:hypothetical protein